METPKIVIAIDGYSSSGKSTMAKKLAQRIGYIYVDSGAMYRAVTLYAIRKGLTAGGVLDNAGLVAVLPEIEIAFQPQPDGKSAHTLLNGEDVEKEIRGMAVADMVSPVAAVPEVRHFLVKQQQLMGNDKGIVMDGRDIGTTVFPDAEMKVFVDASAEVRATRRYKELQEKGDNVDYASVLANIQERDHIDRTRKESPLRCADDAIVLNNDHMTCEQQEEFLVDLYNKTIKSLATSND
jgi:cytidylate kinase